MAHRTRGDDAAHSWLERLGLGDRVLARVEALSHGNQQRVQLAAALVHHPDLLILDEPFAGLDPIATDVMVEVLREQAARGVPVLFSSHQLELVEHLCEAVAIIDQGRVIVCGEVDELRAGGPRLILVDRPARLNTTVWVATRNVCGVLVDGRRGILVWFVQWLGVCGSL